MHPGLRTFIRASLLLAGLAAGLACADQADEPETQEEELEPLWEWRLAAFGRYGASYPGSEENQFNLIPLPFPVYRGKFLRVGDDQENPIRGRLLRTDRVKIDFAFDLNFPVDSDDIAARTGMPDLDLLLEVGPELEWEFVNPAPFDAKWYLGFQVRPAFFVRRPESGFPWGRVRAGTHLAEETAAWKGCAEDPPDTELRHGTLYGFFLHGRPDFRHPATPGI